MEHRKEGYESDVVCSSEEDSDPMSDSVSAYSVQSVGSTRLRLRRSSSHGSMLVDSLSSEDDVGSPLDALTNYSLVSTKTHSDITTRSPAGSSIKSLTTELLDASKAASVASSHSLHSSHSSHPPRTLHMRHYFQEDHTYVMDAKRRGNLGRYINVGTCLNSLINYDAISTHSTAVHLTCLFRMYLLIHTTCGSLGWHFLPESKMLYNMKAWSPNNSLCP